MEYEPLWTGLGIAGGYLAAALGISFYARKRIGAKRWRRLHRLTILVYVLGVAHTLGAGTDAGEPWLQVALVLSAAALLFLLVMRILPRESAAAAPPARPAPRPEPATAGAYAGRPG